jgi:hypothetical protein
VILACEFPVCSTRVAQCKLHGRPGARWRRSATRSPTVFSPDRIVTGGNAAAPAGRDGHPDDVSRCKGAT